MDLRTYKHLQKVGEWEQRVQACRTSGLSVVGWCIDNHINPKTYYRWEHICLEEASKRIEGMNSETGLVRIEPQTLTTERAKAGPAATVSACNLVIRCGQVAIEIGSGMTAAGIAELVTALNNNV